MNKQTKRRAAPAGPTAHADIDVRRTRARRRLSSNDPRCLECGETDPLNLELHHVAGRAYDELTVILCRNCHRRHTDGAANSKAPADPPIMERVGHLLEGLAEFLAALVARFRELGAALIEGAKVCPWPYGYVGAPSL